LSCPAGPAAEPVGPGQTVPDFSERRHLFLVADQRCRSVPYRAG
jgi:hypothetical protein